MSYLRYLCLFGSSLLPVVCRRVHVLLMMFGSSLLPVVCRRVHVLFTLCLVRLYFQLFVGGFMSYLRYVWFVFTSSCLQEGSCLIYIMFGSSLLPVVCRRVHVLLMMFGSSLLPVCRRVHVLFTLCLVRLYFQLFVGGFMSYLRYVWFVFTSSCLQEGSCLIYIMFGSSLLPVVCRRVHVLLMMFGSSLLPVVCRRVHVLFTLCLVRLYFQLFVGGFMSYLRYVWFVFTSSCLQEGSCLIYVMFGSSLLPVVCRRVHVLFTLCLVCLYFQLFVGGFMSYLRYVWFVFTSSCLQEGSCLIYVMFGSSLLPVVCRRVHVLFTLYVCLVRLYFQLFVGGFMSYLRYVWFVFTSSCLQEGSCFIYVICLFGSSLLPVVCRRVHVLLMMFGSSLLPVVCRRVHVLLMMFGSSLLPVVCRRVHVLFTLFMFVWFVFTSSCLQEGSCLINDVWFVFTSSCLQEGSCLIYVMFGSSLLPVVCRRVHVLLMMFGSSLLPVVCRRVHVLFTLCLVRLYFQLFVGGFMSY